MRSKLWAANLGFIPHSYNVALLFFRLALGVSMLVLHGWDKAAGYRTVVETFPDPVGWGPHMSLILTIFAEVVCSLMLIAGALSRLAAAILAVTMSVALFGVNGGDMRAPGGELAALYLFGYILILIAGGGRFSADGAGGPWALAAFGAVAGAAAGYPFSYVFQPDGHAFTGSMSEYMANFRGVLRDDVLSTRAIAVWTGTTVICAVAGAMLGRFMYRERKTVVMAETPPPSTPPEPPAY